MAGEIPAPSGPQGDDSIYQIDASQKEDSWRVRQGDVIFKDTGLPTMTDALNFILQRHSHEKARKKSHLAFYELQKKCIQGVIETNVREILSLTGGKSANGKT